MSLHITYHAAERFLQRVFEFSTYTKAEVFKAIKLLSKDVANVRNRGKNFILPTFPDFIAITQGNSVVTIIPKR